MSKSSSDILFTKMHGIGNDYVYIDCLRSTPDRLDDLAREMSPHHFGIGSDGIILILPSNRADFKMRIFNADGSEARMCGNGSRCVAKYVYDKGLTDKTTITLDTLSGIKILTMHLGDDGKVEEVTVDMGAPSFSDDTLPANPDATKPQVLDAGGMKVAAVSMGNPHGVVFVENALTDEEFFAKGPELENHPMWPDRANIEFVKVRDRHSVDMRVWERGSGETMACGTGACATAVAAIVLGHCDSPVTVHLRGGDLTIGLNPEGHVMMRGGATTVYEGTYTRKNS